jgi:hypothetical protein
MRIVSGLRVVLILSLLAPAALAKDASSKKTVIYFTRHQNDQNRLITTSTDHFEDVCHGPTRPCCEQELNPLGVERAARFADWFEGQHLADRLDLVVSTFKPRTGQTVIRIATDAELPLTVIPAGKPECTNDTDPLISDATVSMQPMYDYLSTLPQGTVALVASHSTTLYQIFDRFGIDVLADTSFFPLDLPAGATTCDPHSIAKSGPVNSRGCKVLGFSNLWRMEIDQDGHATMTDHWLLDLEMTPTGHAVGHSDDD